MAPQRASFSGRRRLNECWHVACTRAARAGTPPASRQARDFLIKEPLACGGGGKRRFSSPRDPHCQTLTSKPTCEVPDEVKLCTPEAAREAAARQRLRGPATGQEGRGMGT